MPGADPAETAAEKPATTAETWADEEVPTAGSPELQRVLEDIDRTFSSGGPDTTPAE
jgi:hypothetical protein